MAETVLIAGYYGRRNAGDEAILGGMLAELRAARVDLRFRVVSWDPDGTQRLHGVEAIPWTDVAGLIDAVREASLVVVGGGGLFHDYWGVEPGEMLTARQAGIPQYGAPIVLARLQGVPSMLYGVGVGPLRTPEGRRLTRELFEAVGAATVRDAASRGLLAELGCLVEPIEVVADPAFHLPPAPADPAVTRVLRSMQRPILGVSLRHWEFGDVPADWQAGLAAAIDDHLAEKGGTALLVPLQDGELEVEDDVSVSRLVIGRMERGGQAALVPDGLDPLQRFRLLEGCDAVLGMRLHAVIAALRAEVPVVGLAYDPKVAALMEASGLGGACLGPEGWQRGTIAAALREAVARPWVEAMPEAVRRSASRSAEIASRLLQRGPIEVPLGEAALRGLAVEKVREVLRLEGDVEAQAARLTSRAEEFEWLSKQTIERREEIAQLKLQVSKRGDEITRLELRASEQTREKDELVRQLTSLRSTLGVRILASYWSWVKRALPPGSRRRRLAASIRRAVIGARAQGVPAEGLLATAGIGSPSIEHEELQSFLHRYQDAKPPLAVLILAPTQLDLDEGQRSTHLAYEFARRKIPVIFAYWRWRLDERRPQGELERGILQIPLDELVAAPREALDLLSEARRLLLMEFPHPSFFGLTAAARGRGWISIYDVVDDWREFHRVGQAPWYREDFEVHLLSTADAVIAVSPTLQEKARSLAGRGAELIPNGVGLEVAEVDRVRHLERGSITLGYFGHLTQAWFDWDLVRSVAAEQPDWRIHLVGYGQDATGRLPPNVVLHGKVPRNELASYAANWDVGIIPFRRSPLAASADPIKLYEYLALGLPVVTTGVAPPAGVDGLVARAEDKGSFIAEAIRAFGMPQEAERRKAFAAGCLWESRVDKLLDLVNRGSQRIGLQEALFEARA